MNHPPNEVRVRFQGREYVWRAGDTPQHLLPAIDLLNYVYEEAVSGVTVALGASKPIVTDNPDFVLTKPK